MSRACMLLAVLVLALATTLSAEVIVPETLAARRAELETLQAQTQAWAEQVGPRLNRAIERIPEFMTHHRRVQAVALTRAERKALAGGGLEALDPAKAELFREAAPAFAEMKALLEAYFEAYDAYQMGELNGRCFGLVLSGLERYEAVEPHLSVLSRPRAQKKRRAALEAERVYRTLLADPGSKNNQLTKGANTLFFKAHDLDEAMAGLEKKHGLAPKGAFSIPLAGLLHKARTAGRAAKIYAAAGPAFVRMLAYLFNPFRKKTDAEKLCKMLKAYSKAYRWAAGMKLRLAGEENVPSDAPAIFALSHRSHVDDGIIMMAVMPRTFAFLLGGWAYPAFLNKKLIDVPTVINVGAKKPDGTTVDAIADSAAALEEGYDLAIFPEGCVPTMQKETRPLRHGLAVIPEVLDDTPVYVVPISIDDPSAGYDNYGVPSFERPQQVTVTFGKAIDPLKFRSVPGTDQRFLLNVVRAYWHRDLYRKDVALEPPDSREAGTIPASREGQFESLYGDGEP